MLNWIKTRLLHRRMELVAARAKAAEDAETIADLLCVLASCDFVHARYTPSFLCDCIDGTQPTQSASLGAYLARARHLGIDPVVSPN